jgi:hypothetical protein
LGLERADPLTKPHVLNLIAGQKSRDIANFYALSGDLTPQERRDLSSVHSHG